VYCEPPRRWATTSPETHTSTVPPQARADDLANGSTGHATTATDVPSVQLVDGVGNLTPSPTGTDTSKEITDQKVTRRDCALDLPQLPATQGYGGLTWCAAHFLAAVRK